jgi:hypothetical protein
MNPQQFNLIISSASALANHLWFLIRAVLFIVFVVTLVKLIGGSITLGVCIGSGVTFMAAAIKESHASQQAAAAIQEPDDTIDAELASDEQAGDGRADEGHEPARAGTLRRRSSHL